MEREIESKENYEMRQLAKDIHRELGELLIRIGRIEERQIELEKSAIEDSRIMKEYVKEEIDYIWNSMVNYIDAQIEGGTNRKKVRPREYATEMAITTKADTPLPRCFNCDDFGHIGRDCPHAGTDLRICFECKQLSNHIASQCPQRQRNSDSRERHFNRPYHNRGDYRGIKRRRENQSYDSN